MGGRSPSRWRNVAWELHTCYQRLQTVFYIQVSSWCFPLVKKAISISSGIWTVDRYLRGNCFPTSLTSLIYLYLEPRKIKKLLTTFRDRTFPANCTNFSDNKPTLRTDLIHPKTVSVLFHLITEAIGCTWGFVRELSPSVR